LPTNFKPYIGFIVNNENNLAKFLEDTVDEDLDNFGPRRKQRPPSKREQKLPTVSDDSLNQEVFDEQPLELNYEQSHPYIFEFNSKDYISSSQLKNQIKTIRESIETVEELDEVEDIPE